MVRYVLASMAWMHAIKTWDSPNGSGSYGPAIEATYRLRQEAFSDLCDIAWPTTIGNR